MRFLKLQTLTSKLLATVMAGAMVPISLQSALQYSAKSETLESDYQDEVDDIVFTLASGMTESLWNFAPESATPILEKYSRLPHVGSIRILDHKNRVFIEQKNSDWPSYQFSDENSYLAEIPIQKESKTIGTTSIRLSKQTLSARQQKLLLQVVFEALLTISTTLLSTFILIRLTFLKKMMRLKHHADRLRSQRLNMAFVWPHQGDEIDQIGASFEKARSTINQSLLELKHKNQELADLNSNLEKEIADKSHQIVESTRLASLAEMSCGIAHEVNTPLAIISAKARRIQKNIPQDSELKTIILPDLNVMNETIERISKIVAGLRTFSRDGTHDPLIPTQIQKVLDEVLVMCQTRLKTQGVSLKIDLPTSDLEVACRPVQLGQVLLNLVNNAIDAIEDRPEKWVEIKLIQRDQTLQLMITDSGLGIPEAVQKKLMQPFFTTKPVGKGTGLGLSISRGIIESHNGRLYIDNSCPNTRFVIELPHQPASAKKQTA